MMVEDQAADTKRTYTDALWKVESVLSRLRDPGELVPHVKAETDSLSLVT